MSICLLLLQGVVHGDPGPPNILIASGHVSGIIDWEEVHPGWPIFDLTILCSQLIMSLRLEEALMLETVQNCVDGFVSILPLPSWELDLLGILIPCRAAQIVCLTSEVLKTSNPNDYLMDLVSKGEALLTFFSNQKNTELFSTPFSF